MERAEPWYTLAGMQTVQPLHEKQHGDASKKLRKLPHDPSTCLLVTYPKTMKTPVRKDTRTPMFTAATTYNNQGVQTP